MRLFKIVISTALLLFAVLLVIGEISFLVHSAESAETWHTHVSTILLISLCLCAAYLLFRRPVDPLAGIHCPSCLALGGHTPISSYGRSVSPFAMHFGGFLLSAIYAGSKEQRFQCRGCGQKFHSHTAVSRGYRLLFLLFVALIATWFLGELADFLSG
jgi:hypothetical protein